MGTTILAASGDDGANSPWVRDDLSKCAYFGSYPATSKYVLSVGGTTVSQIAYRFGVIYIFIYTPIL